MTTIIAVKQKDGPFLMGADTMITIGARKAMMKNESKIHSFLVPGGNGGVIVVAGSGELRTAYEIENVDFPKHKPGILAIDYLRKLFIPIWRDSINQIGAKSKTEDGAEYINSTLLVVYHNSVFTIDNYMCVLESDHPYEAIGSGAEIALGYLYATHHTIEKRPASILLDALNASAHFDSGTSAPYHIINCADGRWLGGFSPS